MGTNGKQKVIEATRRLVGRQGVAAATMRAIANEAGLSTGAIYHHYKNREEIFYDVMAGGLSETARIGEETRSGKPTKSEVIDEICLNIRQRFEKHDENRLQFYLAQEALSGNEILRMKFREKYGEWIEGSRDLIGWLYGEREGRHNRDVASLLIAAVDGSVLQMLLHTETADVERIVELYREFLKVGIPRFLDHLDSLDPK